MSFGSQAKTAPLGYLVLGLTLFITYSAFQNHISTIMHFLADSRNTIVSCSQITLDPATHKLMSTLMLGDMTLCYSQGTYLLLLSILVHVMLLPSTHASSLPQFSTSGSCYYKHLFFLILRTS